MKIVIVGAGVAGLAIGWRLARAGAEIIVLERAQVGRGATGAAAGMIATAAEFADSSVQDAAFARRSASFWPHFAAELEQQSGLDIRYRRDGALIVAATHEDLEGLSAHRSVDTSIIPPAEALRLEPLLAPDIVGALWAPDDAQVDNRVLAMALARALTAAGGTVRENEAAVSFEFSNGRLSGIRTPFALLSGDAYVIAAGAWSAGLKGLPPDCVPPIAPVKGEMIALAPRKGETLPHRLIWGEGAYLVPRRDRLFVGATMSREGFDTALTDEARAQLFGKAVRLMPTLAEWEMVEHWAGLRPGTPDDLPIIGETIVPSLFVASGQFRNGILFAPAIAEAFRSLLLDRRPLPEIAPFDPKRFSKAPLAEGRPVL